MQKWAHTLVSIALGAIALSSPGARALVAGNPAGAVLGLAGWAIFGHLLPTPIQSVWNRIK